MYKLNTCVTYLVDKLPPSVPSQLRQPAFQQLLAVLQLLPSLADCQPHAGHAGRQSLEARQSILELLQLRLHLLNPLRLCDQVAVVDLPRSKRWRWGQRKKKVLLLEIVVNLPVQVHNHSRAIQIHSGKHGMQQTQQQDTSPCTVLPEGSHQA